LKKPKSRTVSKKAVVELLRDTLWVKEENFTQRMVTDNVTTAIYTHPDGRVLHLVRFGGGRLYPSTDEFLLLLQSHESLKPGVAIHLLKGRFPYGQDFPAHVPQLVDELAALLKIPREELDNTEASLDKVDAKVKRIGRTKSLEIPVFPALVAYVGEVMRHETHGKWEIRQDYRDPEIWEPWIIDLEGRSCNPFLAVYDELAEQSPMSIRGATGARIHLRQVLPPPGPPRRVAYYKTSDE
jgi:hypothetical protein